MTSNVESTDEVEEEETGNPVASKKPGTMKRRGENEDLKEKLSGDTTKKSSMGGARQNKDSDVDSDGERGKESRHIGKSQRRGKTKESWEEMLEGSSKKERKESKGKAETERKKEGLEKRESKTQLLKGAVGKQDEALTEKSEKCKGDLGLVEKNGGSLGGKQGAILLDHKESDEENRREGSEEEIKRSGEKTTATEKRRVKIIQLERAATLKGFLFSKGISKVAVTGLSTKQKEKCILPSSLLAEVRSADLLFVKCEEHGLPILTPNFYLGRAYGLQVANASFLQDWEEKNMLDAELDNYAVVGSYLKQGKFVPLKPIKEPLMIGAVFCITSFEGSDHPVDLARELIIRMGGRIVDENSNEQKIHYIGNEWIPGKTVFRPDWIFDCVEQGRVLAKKRFLIEPPKEEEDETVLSQVRNTRLYSSPELNVDFRPSRGAHLC